MTFGERLHQLRISRDITQADLAKYLHISKSLISMYERNQRKPSYDILEGIADFFNVDMNTLTGKDTKYPSSIGSKDISLPPGAFKPKLKKVPMLGYAAAGKPLENADNQFSYLMEASADYNVDFCITIRGDSMVNAGINDGDIVFVRSQPVVENGQIACVEIDGNKVCIKRFYRTDNGVMLVSENPKYPPMVFDESNCDDFRILGLAVVKQSEIH